MTDRPIHVLLIEDNPGDIRLIEEMLKQSTFPPCELFHINNLHVNEREKVADKTLDIILLDLHFDDMTGLDTYNYANLYFPLVPIIVLTGLQDEHLAYEMVKRGAQDYLLKDALEQTSLMRSIRY